MTPESSIILINAQCIDTSYSNIRLFNDKNERDAYYLGQQTLRFDNCTYVRQERYVAIDANADNLQTYNYMMYQNSNFQNRWFYAFITRIEYRGISTAWVYFEIDQFTTWFYDAALKDCLVLREHVGIEQVGDKYIAPEPLNSGPEYEVIQETFIDNVSTTTCHPMIVSTVDLAADFGTEDAPILRSSQGVDTDGLPSACSYYVLGGKYGDTIYDLMDTINACPWVAKGIIGITMVPDYILDNCTTSQIVVGGYSTVVSRIDSSTPITDVMVYYKANILDVFPTEKHVKMYNYPYAVIELSDLSGSNLLIYPQYINSLRFSVHRSTAFYASPDVKYTIRGYRGVGDGYDASLNIRNFPTLPILDISYLQNIYQLKKEAEIAMNQAEGNGVTGIVKSLGLKAPELYNDYKATQARADLEVSQAQASAPAIQGNAGGNTFNLVQGKMGLAIRWKIAATPYRKMISEYWDMFGYQVNQLKTPNLKTMSRYNYIRAENVTICGGIPQASRDIMSTALGRGVTFWHDNDIGNYKNNTGVVRQ